MGSGCKYRWSFIRLPAAHLLTGYRPVPVRGPRAGDPSLRCWAPGMALSWNVLRNLPNSLVYELRFNFLSFFLFFFFHLFINPMVIDGKEIRALSSRSEGKGVVSSSSPPFLTGKGCVWRRPLSFLPQRLCFFPPVPPRFWRGLYNVLWRFCIGLARWLAYRHPDWEDSLSQFPHPQKGYETSTYFRGLL